MCLVKVLLPAMVLVFKGVGEHSLSVWLLTPLLFPLFPRFSFNRKKLNQLCQDGTCSCLQGVICSHCGDLMCLMKSRHVFLV